MEVTLRDGRRFEVTGSNDVDAGNRGVFVEGAPGEWSYVDWYDFLAFEPAGDGGSPGGQEAGR